MVAQVPDQALGVAREVSLERDLLSQGHLKDLVSVLVHEWWPAHHQLVDEDSERVPVGGPAMPHIQDHLWCDVLWRPTQRIRSVPSFEPLHEAKVSELHIPVGLHKHVLRLQVF